MRLNLELMQLVKAGRATGLGIPSREEFGDTRKLRVNEIVDMVKQLHNAQRAGRHTDFRFGSPETGAYSWATRKPFPAPGGRPIMLIRQPLHTHGYMNYSGAINTRYGMGDVKVDEKGRIMILESGPNKIKFVTAHTGQPQVFTMIHRPGKNPKNDAWLLFNTTPGKILCVPAETKIICSTGLRPIKELDPKRENIQVLGIGSRGLGFYKIQRLYRGTERIVWRKLSFQAPNGKLQTLVCGPQHGVYIRGKGFIPAKDVRQGQAVLLSQHFTDSQICDAVATRAEIDDIRGVVCSTDNKGDKVMSLPFFNWIKTRAAHWITGLNNFFSFFPGKRTDVSRDKCCSPFMRCFTGKAAERVESQSPTQSRLSDFQKICRFFKSSTWSKNFFNVFRIPQLQFSYWKRLALHAPSFRPMSLGYFPVSRIANDVFQPKSYGAASKFIFSTEGAKAHSFFIAIQNFLRRDRGNKPAFMRWTPNFIIIFSDFLHFFSGKSTKQSFSHGRDRHLNRSSNSGNCSSSFEAVDKFDSANLRSSQIKARHNFVWFTVKSNTQFTEKQEAFDLCVADAHNYFAEGILVHNSFKKEKYVKVPATEINKLLDPQYVMSQKIDGAGALLQTLKDRIDVLSIQESVSGSPIAHTHRMQVGGKMKLPKELQNKLIRGELYGVQNGKAIPPQELSGILNSSLEKSLRTQKEKGINLRMALFGAPGLSHEERQKQVNELLKYLPNEKFHALSYASTPEDKRRMWKDIVAGRDPLTAEGVVGSPVSGGAPLKVKLRPESDVRIRGIFPGVGRLAGRGAGGFTYSSPSGEAELGRVGTGLSDELRADMLKNPGKYIGRLARVEAQGAFPSGALRAPSLRPPSEWPEKRP